MDRKQAGTGKWIEPWTRWVRYPQNAFVMSIVGSHAAAMPFSEHGKLTMTRRLGNFVEVKELEAGLLGTCCPGLAAWLTRILGRRQ